MPLTFYPHTDDTQKGTLLERIDVMMEAAERYKAIVLDVASPAAVEAANKRLMIPRDQHAAFNWEEIARILREVRELSESTKSDKLKKSELLMKLSEVYETLRGAKMAKLEAVRLALVSEATQLRGAAGLVA
jgi:hypothetical protein